MSASVPPRVHSPEIRARIAALDAARAARNARERCWRDARLTKILVDGLNDLDWAAIFATIDPDQEAGE